MADASTTGDLDGASSVLIDLPRVTSVVRNLNVGYFWMMVNCATSAAYVISACYHGRTASNPRSYRCLRCANESNPQGFLIGTPCFTTICSPYQSSLSFRLSSRTGVRKTSAEACEISGTLIGDKADDTRIAPQRPVTFFCSQSRSRELPPWESLTPPPGVFESRAARHIGSSYKNFPTILVPLIQNQHGWRPE